LSVLREPSAVGSSVRNKALKADEDCVVVQIFKEWNPTCVVKRESEESGNGVSRAAEVALRGESPGFQRRASELAFSTWFQSLAPGWKLQTLVSNSSPDEEPKPPIEH